MEVYAVKMKLQDIKDELIKFTNMKELVDKGCVNIEYIQLKEKIKTEISGLEGQVHPVNWAILKSIKESL